VPDFVAWKALDEPDLGRRSYRLLAIEVEYCTQLEQRFRREAPDRSSEVALQWPELHEILVTEQPEPGRSCFQAVGPTGTLDLHLVPGLDIYRRTVEEYEGLVREVFPLLGSRSGGGNWVRRLGVRRGRPRSGHGLGTRRAAGDHGYRPLTSHEQRQGASE
jgi:hypothetical protein